MKNILATAVVAASVAAPAMAQTSDALPSNFSYNYVEVDYVDMDSDLDGLRILGSFDVHSNVSVIGNLGLFGRKGVDVTNLTVGAAFHMGIPEVTNLDIRAHAELEFVDLDFSCSGCGSDDDRGLRIGAEVRFKPIDVLEVYGDLTYKTVYDNDMILSGGVRFYVVPNIQLTAGLELSDDDALYIGGRFSF